MSDPWLLVAVCTYRRPDAVERTLREVGRQVAASDDAEGLVVADSGCFGALAPIAADAGLAIEDFPEPGIAAARTRAAERAGPERIVAFVDDDIVPEPGWLEALLDRWREAPAELATIGGPILPRFVDPQPRWMSRRLDVVFTVLDRGPGTKPLIPGVEDAWTANASFRAGALLEVGGFDPALGHRGGRTMFGEDTEVQLRLERAGYRGIYAGDVRVEHLIGADRMRLREVFERRFYNGVNMRMTGLWGLPQGLSRLGAGTGETLLGAVTGRPEIAAEGISRVGSGAGVLAEPLVRRRLERR